MLKFTAVINVGLSDSDPTHCRLLLQVQRGFRASNDAVAATLFPGCCSLLGNRLVRFQTVCTVYYSTWHAQLDLQPH